MELERGNVAGKNAGEVTVIHRKKCREQKPGEMALFTRSLHLFTAMPEGQSVWLHSSSMSVFVRILSTLREPALT